MSVSIGILQKRFDTDSLLFEPWKEESDPRDRKVKFDTDGRRLDSASTSQPRPPTPGQTSVPPAPMVATNAVEDLARMLEKMNLNLAMLNSANRAQNVPVTQVAPVAGAGPSGYFPRRCFMLVLILYIPQSAQRRSPWWTPV